MKKSFNSLVVLMGIVSVVGLIASGVFSSDASLAQDGIPNGEPIYREHECMGCHAIEVAHIALDIGDMDPEEVDEDAPDLSAVGKERTVEWMKLYLKKKEKIDGEKHEKKFRGEDEELDILTKWLATMKTEPTQKKKK